MAAAFMLLVLTIQYQSLAETLQQELCLELAPLQLDHFLSGFASRQMERVFTLLISVQIQFQSLAETFQQEPCLELVPLRPGQTLTPFVFQQMALAFTQLI
jgi:hypothetical protein